MPFKFTKLEIPDVVFIEPEIFKDERGFFMETYKKSDFKKFIKNFDGFVQENHSRSTKNVLRGLHYQKFPKEQAKLIRVIKGEIFDVAVDIRKNSLYFKKYVSKILSEENRAMLYIPEGFAHGFCVLSEVAEVVYLTTHEYAPEYDTGIRWNDETIGIDWPIKEPIVSKKDKNLPYLKDLLEWLK